MQKLQAAIVDARDAQDDENATSREQIRIQAIFDKMEREHMWKGFQRWEAHFYARILHEAAAEARQSQLELAKQALKDAIDWAEKYPNEPAVGVAKKKAQEILKKENPTFKEVDDAKDRLISEIRKAENIHLADNIRKELVTLEEAILIGEKYDEHEDVKESLEEAKKVRERAQQGEISPDLLNDIQEAKDKLIKALAKALAPASQADKDELLNKVSQATKLRSKAERAPIIKELLEEAIKNGLAVIGSASEVKYDYISAIQKLDEAIEAVENLPTLKYVEELEGLMKDAKEVIDTSNLSFASKARIYDALANANHVKDDHLAVDNDYIEAIHKLDAALSNVEEAKPDAPASDRDKEELQKAIKEAEKMLKREGLSKEDGRILIEEIAKGKGILNDDEAKKIDHQRATEAIYAAIENARPAFETPPSNHNKEELQKLINQAKDAKERPGISYEDLRTLNHAIEKGEQVQRNKESSKVDYEEAIKILKEALEKTEPMNPVNPNPEDELADAVDKARLEKAMRELSDEKMYVIEKDRRRIDGAVNDARVVVNDRYATKQDVLNQLQYLDIVRKELERLATKEQIQELRQLVNRATTQLGRLTLEEGKALKEERDLSDILLSGYDKGNLEISQKQIIERIYKLEMELEKTIKVATPDHKKELDDKLAQLNKDKDLLTKEEQQELQDVLDKGAELSKDSTATDVDVESIIEELDGWLEKTKLATSKKKLKEMLDQANKKLNEHKNLNIQQLQGAIQAGDKIHANKEANQATVDRAIEDLKEAMTEFEGQIEEKQEADREKAELRVQIAHAEREIAKGVSKLSEKTLRDAIAHGNKVDQDATIPAATVKDAIQDLKDAIKAVEYLANDTLKRALHDKIQEARRLATEGDYTERQKNELTALANEAQRIYKLEELLARQANAEIEKLEAMFERLVVLASTFEYNQLAKANKSLMVIRKLFADNTFDAQKIDKVLNEAQKLLETANHPDRAPLKEVEEKTKEIEALLETYKNVEQERWNEEKKRLEGYIDHMNKMLSKGSEGSEEDTGFDWQNLEDEEKITTLSTESKELIEKAKSIKEVSLSELMDHNAKLREAIESIDKMTDKDKKALEEKIKDVDHLLDDITDDKALFDALDKAIKEANAHLARATVNGDTFDWPGMNRFLFIDLMNKLEDLGQKGLGQTK